MRRGWREAKVHPFLELLGAGCPPPVSDHKVPLTPHPPCRFPMGLTPEPAESISGSKSVLLWIELDFIDFPRVIYITACFLKWSVARCQ